MLYSAKIVGYLVYLDKSFPDKELTSVSYIYNKYIEKKVKIQTPIFEIHKATGDKIIGLGAFRLLYKESPLLFKIQTTNSESPSLFSSELPTGLTLRPYQKDCLDTLLDLKGGIVRLPTGSGKGTIEVALSYLALSSGHSLLIVPNKVSQDTMMERLRKYNIPCVAYSDTRDKILEENTVIVTIPQSLVNDSDTGDNHLNRVKITTVIADECFPGSTKILLPSNKYASIEEVFNNEHIKEVISFNHEKNIFEVKKILRKIKIEHNNYIPSIKVNTNGDIKNFSATENHKLFTKNRGYVSLKDLKENDVLIDITDSYSKKLHVCKLCGEELQFGNAIGSHLYKKHSLGKSRIPTKEQLEKRSGESHWFFSDKHKIKRVIVTEAGKKALSLYNKTTRRKEMLSDLNPVKNSNILKRITESCKKFYKNNPSKLEERKKNFIRAPLAHNRTTKTKPEKIIADLLIDNLVYNGFGVKNNKIFTFKDGKRKIPDFVVEGQNKVVEVSDFNYWYDKSYKDYVVNSFKEIGVSCLYLESEDVYTRKDIKEVVSSFVMNHDSKVFREIRYGKGRKSTYVYNLEVEDNNNYVANGILVSNCHHLRCSTWKSIFYGLPNVHRSFGFSATISDTSKKLCDMPLDSALMISYTGPIVYSKTATDPEVRAYIDVPDLYETTYVWDKKLNAKWNKVVVAVEKNEERHRFIAEVVNSLVKRGYTVLSVVARKASAETQFKYLDHPSVKWFGGGDIESKDMSQIDNPLEYVNSKMRTSLHSIVATNHLNESADIPELDVVILSENVDMKVVLQRAGRAARKGVKKSAVINIFDKNGGMLESQSKKRRYLLEGEYGLKSVPFSLGRIEEYFK